jgi:arylsulfatase A-like enzyme
VKGNPKYGDWVYQGDHMLGQLLDALKRKGLADNTLVIATADNGAAGRPYKPLRAAKTSIYEGGHRVPFVARWPGKIQPGAVCDHTICLNDLMATCAEIVGAKLPENAGEDSVSLLSTLRGTAKSTVREATIHQSMGGDLAIRQGPWKLLFLKSGQRELYNLETDLGEQNNVVDSNSDVVERLTALIRRYIDDGRSTAGTPQKNEAAISLESRKGGKRRRGKTARNK